jgi:hypothetical protein
LGTIAAQEVRLVVGTDGGGFARAKKRTLLFGITL